jgi:hypothetical protein
MIAMMFHSMKKLETSGNIDSTDAVGKSAAVYTMIPDDPNLRGRVRVIIDGRMRYYPARSETGSFARGSQVHISSMDDDRTVLVESKQSDSTK